MEIAGKKYFMLQLGSSITQSKVNSKKRIIMKTFEIFESKENLLERKKFAVTMSLLESAIKFLEAEGDFEWEPQPEFKGVKGTSQDTGFGIQQRKAGEQRQKVAKIVQQWEQFKKYYMAKRKEGGKEAGQVYKRLEQLAALLAKHGQRVEMPPRPTEETPMAY